MKFGDPYKKCPCCPGVLVYSANVGGGKRVMCDRCDYAAWVGVHGMHCQCSAFDNPYPTCAALLVG